MTVDFNTRRFALGAGRPRLRMETNYYVQSWKKKLLKDAIEALEAHLAEWIGSAALTSTQKGL